MTPDRLFVAVNATDVSRRRLTSTLDEITQSGFNWASLVAYVVGRYGGTVPVDFGYAGPADGVWTRHGLGIRRPASSVIAHEIGHLVDRAVLSTPTRSRLIEILHRRTDGWHDEDSHHPRSWDGNRAVWKDRPSEAFASLFVARYAPGTLDGGSGRRVSHWLFTDADTTEFWRVAMSDATSVRATRRLAGPSRYATSAAVARDRFPGPVDRVYIATGDDWPDTVTAGALATDGPLLLVPRDGRIPDEVRDVVADLDPKEIVAVGGTAAVPQSTLDTLAHI